MSTFGCLTSPRQQRRLNTPPSCRDNGNDNKAEIVVLKQVTSCDSDLTKSTTAGSIFSALSSVIQFHDIESSPSSNTKDTDVWSIVTAVRSTRSHHSRNTNSSIKHVSIRGPRSILRASTFASSKITYADFSYDEYASDDDTMITQGTGISAPRYQPRLRQQQSQEQNSVVSCLLDQICLQPEYITSTDSTFSSDTEDTPVYEMVVSKNGSEVCKCECSAETDEKNRSIITKGTLNFGDGESEKDLVNFEYLSDMAWNIGLVSRNVPGSEDLIKKKKNTLIAWKEDVEIMHFDPVENSSSRDCRSDGSVMNLVSNESENEEDDDDSYVDENDDNSEKEDMHCHYVPKTFSDESGNEHVEFMKDESDKEGEEGFVSFISKNPDLVLPFTLVPLLCMML